MKGKLLFTASTYSHILQFHLPYLRQLHEEGWTIDVACGGSPEPIPYASQSLTLPFKKKMTSRKNFRAAFQLRTWIQKEQYTAIITHTSLAAFFTRLAVLGLPMRPRIVHVVHGYLFDDQTPLLRRWLLLTAERLTAPVTDLLLTMNSYDDHIAKTYRLGKKILQVSGMGVPYSPLNDHADLTSPWELRRKLGIPADACVLIYPAEFSVRKSQQVLLRAMTRLPEHVVLVLPGTGVCLARCKRFAKQLNLSHRVFFPGYVTDIGAWYAMADMTVASSRSEGMPFSIIESMYFGLPVIASAVKGHTDLIHDQVNGFLYPYGDWVQCADGILQLIQDPALARSLAQKAQEQIAPYGLDHVQPIIIKLYHHILDEAGTTS